MFTIVSKNKGFYKLQEGKIFYNVSEKRFNELLEEGKIINSKKPSNSSSNENQNSNNDSTGNDSNEANNNEGNSSNEGGAGEQDLSKLKKEDLAEIAKRFGFAEEITKEVTKAILIEFINENSK